jgi:hypothetical protein
MTEQTNTTPVTDEQLLATLEERVAALPEGPLRSSWEEICEIQRRWQRCRALEAKTKVTLPFDSHGRGWTGKPAPSAPTPAELSQQRPGFVNDTPLASPPGLRWVDAQLDAQDAKDRMEREREYRQYFLDRHYEAKLDEREYQRQRAEARSFHKSPDDSDFNLT